MASNDESPDGEDPSEKLRSMFCDPKYKACYELYNDVSEALKGDRMSMLERLTLQYHVMGESPVPIAEVVHRRMEGLKEGQRDLRVYIAGEIAVGKTTFLNLLMGGNYLPTGHGSCTNVLCEVHNNPNRLGVIVYDTTPPTYSEIHLNTDCNSEEWRQLQNCIRDKKHNLQNVSKVQIYWPIEIFKSFQQTEPKELESRTSDSANFASDTVGIIKGDLPIVFMDFPGIDPDHEELFRPYLQHLDKCHTFIFIIDVHRDHGVHGPTLQKLMSDMTNEIDLKSTTLDPESALFICTDCPKTLLEDQTKRDLLAEKVLNRIQMCWPMVGKNQIVFLKDQEQIKRDTTNLVYLQNDLVNFLVKSEDLLLEENCMWLFKLLECISAEFEGTKLKSLEDISHIDRRTRESIENLIAFHDHLTTSSDAIKQIRHIQKKFQEKIKKCLDNEIKVNELRLPDIKSLRDRVGPKLLSFQEECDREIEIVLDELRNAFQNTFVLYKSQKPTNNTENNSLFVKILSISLMAVFLWPIGLSIAALTIFEFVTTIKEGDIISKSSLIKKIMAKLKENVDSKLDRCLHEIDRQRKDLMSVLDQNQRSKVKKMDKDRIDHLQKFNDIAKCLWDAYIGTVMKHEFSLKEMKVNYHEPVSRNIGECTVVYNASYKNQKLAVKEFQPKIVEHGRLMLKREKEDDASDSTIFHERCLLRHLALKKADEDYRYFVQYEGSACRLDELAGHCCLQLVTKPYKCSLLDTIKNGNLTEEKKKQNYAKSAARGLRFLHKHHVVHKDVQLSNYLIDDEDNLVICNVGYFKQTRDGQTICERRTFSYLAPEIRNHSHAHSTASDIYSFGLLLWELWNGQLIESEEFVSRNILQSAGDEFQGLVQSCVDCIPTKRPTVFEIVMQLDKIFHQ